MKGKTNMTTFKINNRWFLNKGQYTHFCRGVDQKRKQFKNTAWFHPAKESEGMLQCMACQEQVSVAILTSDKANEQNV